MVEGYHNNQLLKAPAFFSFPATSAFFFPVMFGLGKEDSRFFEIQHQATDS